MIDLANILENSLRETNAHFATNFFLLSIIIIFTTSIFLLKQGKAEGFTDCTPSLITSLGILGTFVGIVIGLLDFNQNDMDKSMELLLNGLKIAFISSLFGMLMSIIYKITSAFFKRKSPPRATRATIEDLLKSIESINKNSSKNKSELLTMFSLFSDNLWDNMEKSSKNISEFATKQIIDALDNVVMNFNDNLKEEFGENFKKFNDSIKTIIDLELERSSRLENLINLESEHSSRIEEMIRWNKKYYKGIELIDKSISNIDDKLKNIPKILGELDFVFSTSENQINKLSEQLSVFDDVREGAEKSLSRTLSVFDKNLKDLLKNEISSINELFATLEDSISISIDKTATKQTEIFDRSHNILIHSNTVFHANYKELMRDVKKLMRDVKSKSNHSYL